MKDLTFKPFILWIAIAALSAFFTGCSSWNPLEIQQVMDKKESQTTFYGSTAAVRNVVVRNKDGNRVICAEPMPDAAFDEEEEADWDFSFISLGGDEKGEEQSGNVEAGLGGRSSNVLITREILFRYCEFLGNGSYTNKEKVELFKTVLDSVVTINAKSLGTGTRAMAKTSMDVEEGHSESDTRTKRGQGQPSSAPPGNDPYFEENLASGNQIPEASNTPQNSNVPVSPTAGGGTDDFEMPPN